MNKITNALTIDLEDWYQVTDFEVAVKKTEWDKYESRVVQNTKRLLKILDEYQVKATFFVLTWNAEKHPELIKEVARHGHEIGTHGHSHKLIYEQSADEFDADIRKSIDVLESIINDKVIGYRAPSFSITEKTLWALDVLLNNGIKYDSSIFPFKRSLYGIANGPQKPCIIRKQNGKQLIELPMSVVRLLGKNIPISGGAYLRVFPYWFFKWGLKQINKQGRPGMVYLHPWEIDADQPKIKIQYKQGYSLHYVNIANTERKLRKLLQDFPFAPIRDILSAQDKNHLEYINLKGESGEGTTAT